MDRLQCLRLLASAHEGHLGLNVNAMPAIFPINYVLEVDEVVFRIDPRSKLAGAIAGNVVCIQMEADGWSVSVHGQALVDGPWVRVVAELVSAEPYSAASFAQ